MEELEALLASVKAWASKIWEALRSCLADCDALKVENAALKARVEELNIPRAEPEDKPFDLGPILAMIGEFKQQIEAIRQDADNRHGEISSAQTILNNSMSALSDKLDAVANRTMPDLSAVAGLPAFINKANVDLDYFRSKLNRLPF